MWTCAVIKKNAWRRISPEYVWAVLLILLFTFLQSVIQSFLSGISGLPIPWLVMGQTVVSLFRKGSDVSYQDAQDALILVLRVMWGSFLMIFAVTTLVNAVYVIFLRNPLQCGIIHWFVVQRSEETKPSIKSVLSIFRAASYKKMVKGMAWRYLWMCLWGIIAMLPLLLPVAFTVIFGTNAQNVIAAVQKSTGLSTASAWVLTGLVLLLLFLVALLLALMILLHRYYAYFYVPYILLNEPDLGPRDAMNRSKEMTRGQISKMCILDISFIGWWILVALSGGFLMVALLPYLYASYTELYYVRKAEINMQDAQLIITEGETNVDMQ